MTTALSSCKPLGCQARCELGSCWACRVGSEGQGEASVSDRVRRMPGKPDQANGPPSRVIAAFA